MLNGLSSIKSSNSSSTIQSDNLAVLKSIHLTPPSANNRQHRTHHYHHTQNGNGQMENGAGSNSNNNNFFTNHLNGTSNGVGNEFVADFRKASIYNSNNSLNSTGSGNSGHQVNGKITNETTMTSNNGDLNANFADFENNNCIYNAAGECCLREINAHYRRMVRIIQVKIFFSSLLCLSWDQFYFLVERIQKKTQYPFNTHIYLSMCSQKNITRTIITVTITH